MLYLEFWSAFWKSWDDLTSVPVTKKSERAKKPVPVVDDLSSQEKYEYLTEYGTQILCLLSAENGCSYLSRNFQNITGQNSATYLNAKFYRLVHSDFRARLQELLSSPEGEAPQNFRCKLQHADKKWYWYLFMIHPKQGSEKHEFVCIMENIHETMQTQNTLQKARLEAELALRTRSEFLANMSHELRTPLNAVIGFSQIIESEIFGKIDTPQYLEYVKHIQEGGYDLLAKIEDLLEIANIDAGRVTLNRGEVYLSDIVKQVMEAQTHHASSARVILEANAGSDVLLHVDRLKLQHILGHLVANAIKFSPPGGKILLVAEQTGDGHLLLGIHDTGEGITEEKLNEITSALKEDNCWTAKNSHSIGIGLALTKEFVALHGGTVTLSSQQGAGTSIHILLPPACIRAAAVKELEYLHQAVN